MNGHQVHWSYKPIQSPATPEKERLEWNYQHQQTKHSGMNFAFQKRTGSIDWRKIAAADVDVITRTMDFNALQDNIVNIAFCDIERELVLQQLDPNYVKVFQMAQLTIEYLLHSQEFLLGQLQECQLLLNQSNEELQKFKPSVEKLHEELNNVKKESHKRKKIIATQQMIMKIGKDSYNKCPYCEKAFMNQSFLTAHIRNRHSKDAEAAAAVSATMLKAPVALADEDKENIPLMVNGKYLDKEVRALKDQLLLLEQQLAEERKTAKNSMTSVKGDRKSQEESWKESQRQAHEKEMKRLKESFLREINELHEKRRSADEALVALQKRKGVSATNDLESAELRKQREEVAQMREELIIQKIDVIKLKEMLQAKLKVAGEKKKNRKRRLNGKIRDGDPAEKKETAQSLGLEPSSERRLNDDDDDDDSEDSYNDSNDDVEMLLTELSNFEESVGFSQRTFPTVESLTLSLSETGRNTYHQRPDKSSTLGKGLRKEAEQELEARLEKWGVNPRMHQINSSTFESVTRSLKTDRTKMAKLFPNFYAIRNQYVMNIDEAAKESLAEHRSQGQLKMQLSSANNRGPTSSAARPMVPVKSSVAPVQGNMATTVSSTGQSFTEIGLTYTSTGSSLFSAGSLSVKDLDSDEDDKRPTKNASAAVIRSQQPPTTHHQTPEKKLTTPQPTKRETVPGPESVKAGPDPNEDPDDWDEISEIPVDINLASPFRSPSAVKPTAFPLENSQIKPKPSPRARNAEMGSMSSLEEAAAPQSSFATSQSLQRHTLPRSIMHSNQEPSFTGSLTNKGKKLKNSVTFSDDLESTEEALSVRDL